MSKSVFQIKRRYCFFIWKNCTMCFLLKLEAFGLFILSVFLFSMLDYSWGWFPALLLLPDISMLGYAFGNRIGAYSYNLFHHKLTAIAAGLCGFYFQHSGLMLAGIILFGHSAMDRMFGYGLKFSDSFQNTHLGRIGKRHS